MDRSNPGACKMNSLVSFVLEESMYRTRAIRPGSGNIRSEFGPIFSF